MKALPAIFLGAAMLNACSNGPRPSTESRAPGAELIGRNVRLETSSGQASILRFEENGVVHAQFGGKDVAGNWVATRERLCFSWAGTSRECWPYSAPFERGETLTLTSDRGNVVKVTLQ
jgi:hypothetical protein